MLNHFTRNIWTKVIRFFESSSIIIKNEDLLTVRIIKGGEFSIKKRWHKKIVLCNIFTATVTLFFICCCFLSFLRCEDCLSLPISINCFRSSPLYTFPNAPSPMILSKEMSSKRTSHGSKSPELVLTTCIEESRQKVVYVHCVVDAIIKCIIVCLTDVVTWDVDRDVSTAGW